MSYLTQDEISASPSMQHRVAQCYAQENSGNGPGNMDDPDRWMYNNRRIWAAAPGWDEAWEYARNTHTPVEGEPPFDPGKESAVITDAQILAQVQSML